MNQIFLAVIIGLFASFICIFNFFVYNVFDCVCKCNCKKKNRQIIDEYTPLT